MDKELIDKMMQYVEPAADFATEQAPLVVQEVLTRGIVVNSLWMVGLCFITVVLFCVSKVAFKQYKIFDKGGYSDMDKATGFLMLYIARLICVIVIPLCMTGNIYNICMIYFCPRLYIFEYLWSLVK